MRTVCGQLWWLSFLFVCARIFYFYVFDSLKWIHSLLTRLRNLRHTFLLGSLSKSSVSSSSASSMSILALWLTAAGRFERVSSDNEGGGGPVFEGPGAILVSMAIRYESMSSFMKSSGGGGAAVCALRGGADGLECKSDRKMTHKIKKSFSCSFWPSWWLFDFLDLTITNQHD